MVENTRTQAAMKEMDDRITTQLESRLIKLTINIQKTLDASLTNSIQEQFRNSQEVTGSHGSLAVMTRN